MTHSQHSPLPWANYYDTGRETRRITCGFPNSAEVIAETFNFRNDAVATRITAKTQEANARLIVASVNAMGELAQYLNCNPVELAERLQGGGLVELVKALEKVPARYGNSFTKHGDRIAEKPGYILQALARITGKNII